MQQRQRQPQRSNRPWEGEAMANKAIANGYYYYGNGAGSSLTLTLMIFIAVWMVCQCVFLAMNEHRLLALHQPSTIDTTIDTTISTTSTTTSTRSTEITYSRKIQQQQQQRWDPGAEGRDKPPTPLKVPTPIWVLSLPKSGTTSIWQYFQCGGWSAAHQWTKLFNGTSTRIGMCMRQNMQNNQALLDQCGPYDVFSDTGFSLFVRKGVSDCFYPSIHALPYFVSHHGGGTLILITRQTAGWNQSIHAHGNGSLLQRWQNCNLINETFSPTALYDWHTQHVRRWARQFLPTNITYIEVALESPQTGYILQDKIGIPASCWGKCSSTSKFCQHVVQ